MKKLLNTLYVTTKDSFVSLENENVVVKSNEEVLVKVPLLNLEGIVIFNNFGASSPLLAECAKRNISVSFLSEFGKFLGTMYGETKGSVLVRKEQFRIAENEVRSLSYAKNFIFGKLHNQKWVIERTIRDHGLRVDSSKLKQTSAQITENMKEALLCDNKDSLRALEGNSAQSYFKVFNELILQGKEVFSFRNRTRRPPLDSINALLSFSYTLLAAECRHALEVVGLDSFVGFMHTDRPGRASLALDLMEELRPQFADRFVLSLINRREVLQEDFEAQESGAVLLNKAGKKKFLGAWQQRKKTEITHPFLEEKCEWGLVPYIQALLLSRAIRNDLTAYPPFLWK